MFWWASELPGDKPSQYSRDDNLRPIFLNKMPGIRYGDALGIGDRRRKGHAFLEWYPFVTLTPKNCHRAFHPIVTFFDLIGIFLIHLRDLPIESGLAYFSEPWRAVNFQCLF